MTETERLAWLRERLGKIELVNLQRPGSYAEEVTHLLAEEKRLTSKHRNVSE